jgi:hypothetical protein
MPAFLFSRFSLQSSPDIITSMKIIILTSIAGLADGTFLPKFSLIQSVGASEVITDYTLPVEAVCSTEAEAWEHAKEHGKRAVMKEYGEEAEISVQKQN